MVIEIVGAILGGLAGGSLLWWLQGFPPTLLQWVALMILAPIASKLLLRVCQKLWP